MRNLVSVSLYLLMSAGCAVPMFDGYSRNGTGQPATSLAELDRNVFWFRNDTAYSLYSAAFDIRKNHFTGLMVYNPLPDEGYRMVFMTEFGLKVFDMAYDAETGLIIHYLMPALDRKALVRLLRNDLQLLSAAPVRMETARLLADRDTGKPVLQARDGGNKYDCFIHEKTGRVNRIIQSSRLFRKVQVDYYSTDGIRLDSVKMQHLHMKLHIKLTQIDEITTPADGQAL